MGGRKKRKKEMGRDQEVSGRGIERRYLDNVSQYMLRQRSDPREMFKDQ